MSRSNPDKIEQGLSTLWDRETAFQAAVEDDAMAEHAFKLKKAQAFLAAEGTEKARDARSIVDSEKLFLDHVKKKAVKEFTREKLRDAQMAITARQSLLKYQAQTDFAYTTQT